MTKYLLPLCWLSAAAAVQPAFVVSAATLWYGAEDSFTVTSQDTDMLSITFPATTEPVFRRRAVLRHGTGRAVGSPGGDPGLGLRYFHLPLVFFPDGPLPDIRLSPGDTASFRILWLDACPLCRAGEVSADTLRDPLHLRVADETGADTVRVVLETIPPTPIAPGPAHVPLRLRLYPNPVVGPLSVGVDSDKTGPVTITVADILGRTVGRFESMTNTSSQVDLGRLAAGMYVVRADVPGVGAAVERLVVPR